MKRPIILILSAMILSSCSFRGFQPPPDTWENFYKIKVKDTNYTVIKNDMLECGFKDVFKASSMTNVEYVEAQICMTKKGYKNNFFKTGVCNDEYFGKYCSQIK